MQPHVKTFHHGYWCLLDRNVFWWVTSPWLPQLLYSEFTVWFPHKQHMYSALFHHLHPWSQVYCRRAKRQSSHWRSPLESCPSCRCMSSSHLSVRLRPRNSNRWEKLDSQIYDYTTVALKCFIFVFTRQVTQMKSRVCSGNGLIQIGVAAIVNNPRVSATRILMFPVQTTIHHNDFLFYFSSCMFKMLFGETTNQCPSWF